MNHSAKILITTWGSYGDLHPYVAVALGLQARGHHVTVGTGECYRRKVESLGLGFRAIRPDCDWVTDQRFMRDLMHPRWGTIRAVQMTLRGLRDSYDDTFEAATGCDLLVSNMVAYATGMVAEKKGIPWVSVMHIPTGLFSAYDPPLIPGFATLSKRLRFLGPWFWGPFGRSTNAALRFLGRPWHRVRKEVGLPRVGGFNPLTESYSPTLHVAVFSKWLADKQIDWPSQTVITGFPWFDADGDTELSSELNRFLESGDPPIVFTLGTAVVADPGQFYEQSIQAAKTLGRRAILVAKNPQITLPNLPDGMIACEYAPFSKLFPRVAAIVHHGGIGTTGQAMRSGRPSLVIPCAWDQPDNAERVVRLGIARTIPRHRYQPERVANELRLLLEDPAYAQQASEIAVKVQQEDGVAAACNAVESMLKR